MLAIGLGLIVLVVGYFASEIILAKSLAEKSEL